MPSEPLSVSAVMRPGDVLRIGPIEIAEENGWITVARCGELIARLSSMTSSFGCRHVNGFPYGGGSVLPELIRADDLGRGAELPDSPPADAPLAIVGPGGDFRRGVLP